MFRRSLLTLTTFALCTLFSCGATTLGPSLEAFETQPLDVAREDFGSMTAAERASLWHQQLARHLERTDLSATELELIRDADRRIDTLVTADEAALTAFGDSLVSAIGQARATELFETLGNPQLRGTRAVDPALSVTGVVRPSCDTNKQNGYCNTCTCTVSVFGTVCTSYSCNFLCQSSSMGCGVLFLQRCDSDIGSKTGPSCFN